jgi:hypothetical protein
MLLFSIYKKNAKQPPIYIVQLTNKLAIIHMHANRARPCMHTYYYVLDHSMRTKARPRHCVSLKDGSNEEHKH